MSNNPFPRMHVSLYVKNIEQTVKFYNAFFGQEPSKVKPFYAKYTLESPSLIISFVENPERVQANFGHLGFQLETKAEVEERMAAMKVHNLVSLEEMGTACCYAVQDKFWATDPDGVQWEVYYFHADSEFNDPHYSNTEAAACCMPQAETKAAKVVVQLTEINVLTPADTSRCKPGGGCC
jgi:catechol 2,3-dioxygenase-like lactoylglutathione lyase family enzyme